MLCYCGQALIQIFQFSEVWLSDEPDIHNLPKYTLVKSSMDNSLETLAQSTKNRCLCFANADREASKYENYHAWTSQIVDVTSAKIAHTSKELCACMDEIIKDIMCTKTTGIL